MCHFWAEKMSLLIFAWPVPHHHLGFGPNVTNSRNPFTSGPVTAHMTLFCFFFTPLHYLLLEVIFELFSIFSFTKNIKTLSFIRQWPLLPFTMHFLLYRVQWLAHSSAQEIYIKYVSKVETKHSTKFHSSRHQIWQTSFSQSLIHSSTHHPFTNLFNNFHWALPVSKTLYEAMQMWVKWGPSHCGIYTVVGW